jgi:hypothetical protein
MAAYEHSDYRAALFRRKTTQFSKLLDEGKKLYEPLGAELVYKRSGDPGPSFNFPSGARIFICHMEQEDNKEDHQGIEYQYCGFDELTQFTVTQYMYLFSRLRSTIEGLNPRMRSTTNPTGSGLIWVKKRFIKNGRNIFTPQKLYYFAPDKNNEIEDNPTGLLTDKNNPYSKSRMFIPGRLHENKILMKADPGYKFNIMAMGRKYEKALLYGDWDAFGGSFFDDFDSSKMGVEPFAIPKEWFLLGAIDPGWSSPCSFSLKARDFEGNVYRLFTYYEKNKSPEQHATAIKEKINSFPYTNGRQPNFIVSGTDAFAKKDRHAIIAHELTFSDVFRRHGLNLTPAKTDRVLGWMVTKQLMRSEKFFYFNGFNDDWKEEVIAAEHDEKNPEDIKGKGNDPNVSDHALDEDRYGNMSLFQPVKREEDEPVARPTYLEMENQTSDTTL